MFERGELLVEVAGEKWEEGDEGKEDVGYERVCACGEGGGDAVIIISSCS